MQLFNASAVANISRLAYNPALCLPHLTVPSFDKLPFPIIIPGHEVQVKGIVLDKDNCFAKDQDDKIWPAYMEAWGRLRQFYPDGKLLIVSNSAGTDDDVGFLQAEKIERDTGVTVLRHSTKKPGCYNEIMEYFGQHGVDNAAEIVVIGDRLFTDILMANMMGSWGIWLSEGVELSNKIFPRMERILYTQMAGSRQDPFAPPTPKKTPNL